jgi:hypothetical protein
MAVAGTSAKILGYGSNDSTFVPEVVAALADLVSTDAIEGVVSFTLLHRTEECCAGGHLGHLQYPSVGSVLGRAGRAG